MARPRSQTPSLRYHLSGQSVVTLDGRDFYLGKHGSAESLARYAVLIAEYQQNDLSLNPEFDQATLYRRAAALINTPAALVEQYQTDQPILVCHVTASFRNWALRRFEKQSKEIHRLNSLCDELDQYAGRQPAETFGPRALSELRQKWIERNLSRSYINRLTNAVRRIFKHAVANELVKVSIWERLKAVEPLRYGAKQARECEPVVPVDLSWVRATANELSPVVRDMLRIQVATGMRPSEICRIRPCDVDQTNSVWMYRPPTHKTANRGKRKSVPLVGDARDAIQPYLDRDPTSYCFSPAESMAWFRQKLRDSRKSKVQPSQVTRKKPNPKKQPRDHFDANSYRQSIQRAAKRAGVPSWHPYQLRHSVATAIREALGVEHAQALLGHSHQAMTEHYARISESKAVEAAYHTPTL